MKAQVTLFQDTQAKNGIPTGDSWNELVSGPLAPMSDQPAFTLWTPAELVDGRRKADHVKGVYALVLDFDGKDKKFISTDENPSPPNPPTVDEVLDRWPYAGYWHYTRSHTDPLPCFRVVIPFPEVASAAQHREIVVAAMRRELTLCPDSSIDESCKDPARMWYLPEGEYEWNEVDGNELKLSEHNSWDAQSTVQQATAQADGAKFDPATGGIPIDDESRIAAYLTVGMPPAIAGQGGHTATFNAARKVADFGISDPGRIADLLENYYNPRCEPAWSRRELEHKAKEALKSRIKNPVPVQSATVATPPALPSQGGYQPISAEKAYGSLIVDENGKILNRLHNFVYLIHQSFASSIRFDEFLFKVRVTGPLPWDPKGYPRDWTDVDDFRTCAWLERTQNMAASPERTHQAVILVAQANSFDSYTDYVAALPKWDGMCRLDHWLEFYLGAEDTEYNRIVGRAFLIAMMARAHDPGVEVHNILVLEGSQGIGKSRAARIIAGNSEWFSSSMPDMQSKDAAIALQGKTVVEVAELAAMRRSNNESTKEFITRSHDKFRPPFGRHEINRPRRCVFIATTNHSTYLTDETGNRRYWPVRCSSKANLKLLQQERDQLLAEAREAYKKGEKWYSKSLDKKSFAEQRLRNESDPWDDDIDKMLNDNDARKFVCPRRFVDFVSSTEIMSWIGVDVDKRNILTAKRINRMMRARGWAPVRIERRVDGRRLVVRGFALTQEQQHRIQAMADEQISQMRAMSDGADSNGEHTYDVVEVDDIHEELEKEVDKSRDRGTLKALDGKSASSD